jgi:hypothetical protein
VGKISRQLTEHLPEKGLSGKVIDIPYVSKEPGTTLELCEDNNQANQRWVFKRSTE